MNQPIRWLDDQRSPTEIRELLRAGSRPPRFPKVALAATIIPLAQKAAMASTWTLPATAMVALKATSVGLALGLGSIVAVTTLSGPESRPESRNNALTIPRTERARALPSTVNPHGPVAPVTVPADVSEELADRAPVALPNGNPNAAAPMASTAIGIAAEAQLLERARSLLDPSPHRALLLTNEHRERFTKGQMSAERELIAIDALLRLGQLEQARQRAKPLLSDGASQVFAQRLRNLLKRHGL